MNKIFISYSRKNTENIDAICRRLDALSMGYWRDRNEISSTEYNFTESFAGGVKGCNYFLIYLTDDYIDSYYCWLELMNSMISKKSMKYIIFNGGVNKYKFSPDKLLGGVSFGVDKRDFSDLIHNSCGKISANNIFSLKESVKNAIKFCDIDSSKDFYRILMVLILSEISIINCENGEYNEMMRCINEMEKISQDIIYSPIFIYAVLLDRMALCASKMGRYSEAVRFRRNSLDHCVVNFGEDNMEALEVRNALVHVLGRSGNYSEALDVARYNLGLAQKKHPADHAIVLIAASTLGSILCEVHDYREAINILEPAFSRVNDVNFRTPEAKESLFSNLATAYMRSGDPRKALQVLLDLDKCDLHISGDIINIKFAECHYHLKEFDGAKLYINKSLKYLRSMCFDNPARVFSAFNFLYTAADSGDEDLLSNLYSEFIVVALDAGWVGDEVKKNLAENPHLLPISCGNLELIDAMNIDFKFTMTSRKIFIEKIKSCVRGFVYGCPDCSYIIGCAIFFPGVYLYLKNLKEFASIEISCYYFFRKSASSVVNSNSSIMAKMMLDPRVDINDKIYNIHLMQVIIDAMFEQSFYSKRREQ